MASEPNANEDPAAAAGLEQNDSDPSDSEDFDPSAEMMVNDFDDEHTLDEEEALAEEDAKEEIDDLAKDAEMPIEELLAMYGYDGAAAGGEAKSAEVGEEDGEQEEKSSDSTSQQSTSQQPSSSNATSSSARATASTSFANMSDLSDSESDEEYSANEDEWRRTIQVGSDYQAVIPEGLSPYGDEKEASTESTRLYPTRFDINQCRDILLWKPWDSMDDERMNEFVRVYDGSMDEEDEFPLFERRRDDDHALYLLFQCNYDYHTALDQHDQNPNPPADSTPVRKMMDPWTEEECRNFESGLRLYGKDFFQIKHNKISTRTVGEVVTFYYFWKKTERHDQFVRMNRVEKKNDYMDRFLDEQENMTQSAMGSTASTERTQQNAVTSSNNSSSNNSHSLLHSASSSHHHHPQLNTLSSRQSSSGLALNSAQSRHHSSSSNHHSNYLSSYGSDRSGVDRSAGSVTISGHNMRTINVSANGEPQTILINDSDFSSNGPKLNKSKGDGHKPVLGAPAGSSKSSSYYHHTPHSSHHSSHHSANLNDSGTTTIVVGKNPVVIDGAWVSSSSSGAANSAGATSNSPTSLSTPSVSIYKIPNNSGLNR